MRYDHHNKAGNQGDVIKHVALIAALDAILQNFDGDTFRYADTFAGYAYSPLIEDNGWEDGIGQLHALGDQLSNNRHTKLWHDWYLNGRPELLAGVYPGSSLIANDVCRSPGKLPSMALWDISPPAVANLMETFGGRRHRVFKRPATPNEPAVRNADFLLIDPPGASMRRKRNYPHWERLTAFLENREVPAIVWLPVVFNVRNGERIEDTRAQRHDALRRGLNVSVIRWSDGVRRPVGCQLFYQLPAEAQQALESAIRHVVAITNWTCDSTRA